MRLSGQLRPQQRFYFLPDPENPLGFPPVLRAQRAEGAAE